MFSIEQKETKISTVRICVDVDTDGVVDDAVITSFGGSKPSWEERRWYYWACP